MTKYVLDRGWIERFVSRSGRALLIALTLVGICSGARANWAELFDQGLTQPWTFFVVENTGKQTTTGTPFVGVIPATTGGAYLRMSHTTLANTGAGGGAAAAIGIVDAAFVNGTVRATLNAAPGDGQRSLLAVFARASASTGRGYLLGVDFGSGSLVLQRADSLAGQALTLATSEIPGFSTSKRYFVELTVNGSSLSGKVSALGSPTTLATVNAIDETIASGRAGILLRTAYTQAGTPLFPIIGTFDDVSVTNQSGGGGPVGPVTSVRPIISGGKGIPTSRFVDGLLQTSLDNTATKRMLFEVTGVAQRATVRLYADNQLIAEQFAGGGGRVLVRTNGTSPLVDGVYDLRASQVVSGSESALIDALVMEIDTIAPAKPSAPDLTEESDTGVSNADNITNAEQLVIRGTADPGVSIALLLKGRPTRLPTTTADSEGNWTFTFPSGKSGIFLLSVVAFDRVGNFSQDSDVTQVIALRKRPKAPAGLALAIEDRDPPPVKRKGAYTNNSMPTIIGKGVSRSTVRVTVAGTGVEFGSAIVGTDGRWSATLHRALPQGDVLIAATQIDPAGNESAVSKLLKLRYEAPIEGTTAERGIADEHETERSELDPGRFDVDGDGRVTLEDVRLAVAWVGREGFPPEVDIDENGVVDADDVASVAVMVGR